MGELVTVRDEFDEPTRRRGRRRNAAEGLIRPGFWRAFARLSEPNRLEIRVQ